jgi:hypothetical protein
LLLVVLVTGQVQVVLGAAKNSVVCVRALVCAHLISSLMHALCPPPPAPDPAGC